MVMFQTLRTYLTRLRRRFNGPVDMTGYPPPRNEAR
jgi:hypothetical protein